MNYGTMGTLLTHLKTDGPTLFDCGICTNLLKVADKHHGTEEAYGRDGRVLRALGVVFYGIGLDGGDPYPIQHPGGVESAEAYSAARRAWRLWSTTEPYGQARWKALDDAIAFCAAQPQEAEIY